MSAGSVSKVDLVLSLKGKALLNLELKRHLAPKTVGVIIRSLPLEGNAHMMGASIAFMDTNLNAGGEKLRTQFKKGDVGFMASNSSICLFFVSAPFSLPSLCHLLSFVLLPVEIFLLVQATFSLLHP